MLTILRGVFQIAFWPLVGAGRLTRMMDGLGLAPGPAVFDLDFRRRDHRRLGIQVWILWLLVIFLTLIASELPLVEYLDPVGYSGQSVLAFGGVVALGASIPAATSTMLVWAVLALATSLTPLKSFLLDVQSPFYAAAVVGTIFGGVRFARNKSIQRHLLTLIASLALVFPAWFLTRIVASALFAMLGTIAMGIVTRSASGSLYGLTQAWDAATKYVSFELSLLWGNLLYAIPAMLVFAAAGQIRRMLTSQDWA